MIILDNITKTYGKKTMFKNLNYRFPTNGIVGLLGDNGSGKTTLLRILCGLRKQDSGLIKLSDSLNHIKNVYSLNPEINDVYNYKLDALGKLYEEFYDDFNKTIFDDIIASNHLDINSVFGTLSKGEKTYVIIALTISRDVPIFLLDEPFTGLDLLVRKKIIKILVNYIDLDHKLVIISSHDMNHLERLIDEVILLKEGTIISSDNVDNIKTKYGSLREWYMCINKNNGSETNEI